MKFGTEVMANTSTSNIEKLERTQNNALRLITGAVKSTPILALQLYTHNLPIQLEFKQQAAISYSKLKASPSIKWVKQITDHFSLKTQTPPLKAATISCNI